MAKTKKMMKNQINNIQNKPMIFYGFSGYTRPLENNKKPKTTSSENTTTGAESPSAVPPPPPSILPFIPPFPPTG